MSGSLTVMKSLGRVWLFATPWTLSYQPPPSMGFSRQEYWSGLPFPSPGDLPDPGIEPASPALQADALPSEPPWKPYSEVLLLSHFSRVDSVQPQRRQPTRLPSPWASPGKNTGMGCHFLLQCMKVKMKLKSLSCVLLLETPWTATHQAPTPMGFSRQEYWSGVPLPSPIQRWEKFKWFPIARYTCVIFTLMKVFHRDFLVYW